MYFTEADQPVVFTPAEVLWKKANPGTPSMDYIEELLSAAGKETFPMQVERLSADYRSGKMRRVEFLEELSDMLKEETCH